VIDRDPSPEDLVGAVRIHRAELHEGFLSSLGNGALLLLFQFAAESPTAVLLVLREESGSEGVAGFLLGTFSTRAFYRDFLRRRFLRACWVLGPRLMTPRRLFKAFETLFYPARKATRHLPAAELLDIAIDRRFHGQGLGKVLFDHFCGVLRRSGVGEFRITTGESLGGAHVFYERLGARRVGDIEVHKGQSTRVYLYSLTR
jgi:GNAT superfamily N-acetyltransferase